MEEVEKRPRPRATKKILHILSIILTVCVVAFTLFAALSIVSARKNNGLVSIGGYHMFVIASGSMKPNLPVGSVVIDTKADTSSLKKGDIISFYSANSKGQSIIITHRIAEVDNNGEQAVFITKGDANPTTDQNPVFPGSVIGKEHYCVPYIGYVFNFITSMVGLAVVVILPLFCLLIYEIVSLILNLNRMSAKKVDKTSGQSV